MTFPHRCTDFSSANDYANRVSPIASAKAQRPRPMKKYFASERKQKGVYRGGLLQFFGDVWSIKMKEKEKCRC